MTEKTDFVGNELEIGDRVVYQRGGRYPGLERGIVTGFTPKMVKIDSLDDRWARLTNLRPRTVTFDKLVKYTPPPKSGE